MRNNKDEVSKLQLDNAAGVLHPYYDFDTKMLYLSGRGEGSIK